jgi:hypothetical protein
MNNSESSKISTASKNYPKEDQIELNSKKTSGPQDILPIIIFFFVINMAMAIVGGIYFYISVYILPSLLVAFWHFVSNDPIEHFQNEFFAQNLHKSLISTV